MKKNGFLGLIKNSLHNNRGQFAIEAVLLMTVMLGVFLYITKYARDHRFIQDLASKPIDRVAIMTGYGTWKDGCKSPTGSKLTIGKCHPNSIHRSLSSDPNPL
jgi:hypothetical protein